MSFIVPGPPPDATQTRRGLVSTVAQTFAGLKRFLNGLRTSKVVFDDLSEQTTAAVNPTLSDSAPGESLIKVASGSALELKRLIAGSGVTLTPTADGVEVAAPAGAPVTLASAGTGEPLTVSGFTTGPDLRVKSVIPSSAHRFTVSTSANRIVIGLEDTGPLDCEYYGPFTYQMRTRIGTTWQPWVDVGTKNHIWTLRSSTPVWARRAGIHGYMMGLVSFNADYKLPVPPDGDTQYQWKPGHTPPDPIVVVGLPTAASPGVNWYSGSYNNWVPGNQNRITHSLYLSGNQVRFMSGTAISEFESGPNGSWLALCHSWMVT